MTHTAKHTPGPWIVTEYSAGMICVAGPDHKDLCAVGYNRTEGRDDVANAHLIAAAPAMYEALSQVQAFIKTLVEADVLAYPTKLTGAVEAALAQAEGKHD